MIVSQLTDEGNAISGANPGLLVEVFGAEKLGIVKISAPEA